MTSPKKTSMDLVFKILRNSAEDCDRKNPPAEKGEGNTSRSKQRRRQKEITFCLINRVFDNFYVVYCNSNAIFEGFSLICLGSLVFL